MTQPLATAQSQASARPSAPVAPFWLRQRLAVALVAAWGAASCQSGGVTRQEFDELKKAQFDTLARVEKVERQQLRPPSAQPSQPRQPPGPDAAKVYGFQVGQAPVRGPADAWVTIVEISDFQCPFCARAAVTVKELEKIYKGDVRVAFKHNPLSFHDRALPAAIATSCAQAQNKFWPMADVLFADQSKLGDHDLEAVAKEAGCNMATYKKCVSEQSHKAAIEADQAQAAKFGAKGTPAFFINGRFLSGAQQLQTFKTIVDEELAKAKASGVAKGSYYAQQVEAKGATSM